MMRWMLVAAACILVSGVGVTHAATVSSSFSSIGQSYGGENVLVDIPVGNLRPVSDATLELSIRGDYDTMGETVDVSLEGVHVGQAGTTMSGDFLGMNVVTHGVGDISFTRTLIIDMADLMSAIAGDGIASLLFDRSANVGGGPNSEISGTLTFAAVPEPSTMVIASLGLVCVGSYTLRRRRLALHGATSV